MNSFKAIKTLSSLGFEEARVDGYGDVIAFFPGDTDDRIVCREAENGLIAAWVLKGPVGMPSPKSITYRHANGCSPQCRFNSVKEAGRLALENPHY
ncbi:MAG: hypothetical protein ACK4FE_09210 [Azonexus sp.]